MPPILTTNRPTRIAFYNSVRWFQPERLPLASWNCELLTLDAIGQADLVIFHLPWLKLPLSIEKRKEQRWVAWSMESEANYPMLADAGLMRQFDWRMGYHRDADVWSPYMDPRTGWQVLRPPEPKTEVAVAAYFASNCQDRSGRHEYVRELMRYIRVDSYGKCLNNRRLSVDHGATTKLETIARYHFTLAFENAISTDYVTEKFFQPLIAGSVPVYRGAPNVCEFAPGDHCFIDATGFDEPCRLADYLNMLVRTPSAYANYLSWKTRPLRPEFLDMANTCLEHPILRLSRKYLGGTR